MSRVSASVGYTRLPSRIREGSKASYAYSATQDARASMQEILKNYGMLIQHVRYVTIDVLEDAIAPTFEKSKVYCPKKTGKLVSTGQIVRTAKDGRPHVSIRYGDKGDPHYAAIVHERTDLNHKPPTRSKWLQAAMEEDMFEFKSRILYYMKQRTGL